MLQNLFSHSFNWQLAIIYLIVFLIMRIPYIGIHVRTINTFYHEIGHAVSALFCNGEIYHIKLNINNSGEALTATKGWIAKFIVSISGYYFPILIGSLILILTKNNHLMGAFYGIFILAITASIMWIRNAYGYIWCIGYVAFFSLILYIETPIFIKYFLAFNIGAMFTENIAACYTLIRIALKNPKQAGDAYQLKQYTFIPTIIWAFIFFVSSLIVMILSLFYDIAFKF